MAEERPADPASGVRSDTRHWDSYWSRGHLTSLPTEFTDNYDGAVAEFWETRFRQVPGDADLLDLCTGNGAVALLAADFARTEGRTLRITAVDAAQIDPVAVAAGHPEQRPLLDAIRFRAGCPVESLPFDAASFDLVTSQYGVEYCDWHQAARQVVRVLRPGGHFVLVSHAQDSDVFSHMEIIEQEYEVLDELAFFPSIRGFLQKKLSFQRFNKVLRNTRARLAPMYGRNRSPFLAAMLGMLEETIPLGKTELRRQQERLKDFYQEFTTARARQDDMMRVNRHIAEQPDWYRVFESGGLVLRESGQIAYLGRSGQRMLDAGDYYCFQKPASEEY